METDLLKENRQLGFVSLEDSENIPPHIFGRLIELRAAKAAGKIAPPPSSYYIAAAERRNLTLPRIIERKLFPVPVLPSLAQRKRSVCLEERVEREHAAQLRSLRARAAQQAAVIAAAAPRKLSADEERQISNERRRCFPWEY
jgi:hypothetical protein